MAIGLRKKIKQSKRTGKNIPGRGAASMKVGVGQRRPVGLERSEWEERGGKGRSGDSGLPGCRAGGW